MKKITQTTGSHGGGGRREYIEWQTAIATIILLHDNYCLLNPTLYIEIKKFIRFTEHEQKPSGEAGEKICRGTLRGYLSDMVRDGLLKKDFGGTKHVRYSVMKPEEWISCLEPEVLSRRMANPELWSTLKYGYPNK